MRVSGDPTSSNNGRFYIHSDHLGSTRVLTKYSDGYIRTDSLARYAPFGAYRTGGPSPVTDRAFTGQKENMGLGLYYYNARFYAPGIGRFLSADTIVPDPQNPQQFNRYAYSLNSPLNFSDPTGHCAVDASGNILLNDQGQLAKTDCTVDDFQALTWNQRKAWLAQFVSDNNLGDWFVDIAHAINVLGGDPDYNNIVGWAAYADAGVLQALNDGANLDRGENAIGSGGVNGGAAWASFFQGLADFKNGDVEENQLIVLRLAGEQGGVDYATTLAETQRRYKAESSRVQTKIDLFLWGANAYRSAGMRCHAGCSSPLSGAGWFIEELVVAHTDPRTSGNTWFIQTISNAHDWLSSAFQYGPLTIETP